MAAAGFLVSATLVAVLGVPAARGSDPTRIVVLGGTSAISAGVATHLEACTDGIVVRVSGANRYETAAAISQDAIEFGSNHVFVATGADFPDAVAAGAPAALAVGPILLTDRDSLPAATSAEISRLSYGQPIAVHILGGEAAVSSTVETALESFGPVERLSGPDRYATAAAIAQTRFGTASTVFVATGVNFPDALAGAPAAAMNNAPILLVTKDSIPTATASELTSLNPTNVVVLGGTGVISSAVFDSIAAQLPGATITRIAGADRYATAAAISASTFSPGAGLIYIATGLNFPDALAGGVAAGYRGGPVLLVSGDSVPAATATEIQRLVGKPCTPYR